MPSPAAAVVEPVLHQIQSFVIKNGVVAATAGWLIGSSATDLVRSAVADVLQPALYAAAAKLRPGSREPPRAVNWDRFAGQLIVFVLMFLMTFVLLQYVVARVVQ